jgi:hypothetical protein
METKKVLTTRRALITGLASAGGLMLAGCSKELPPTYGNVLRMGDLLTYKAHRLLLPAQTLAKEYDRHDISSMPAIGTTNPADSQQPFFNADLGAAYERLRVGDFAEWRLVVEGRVARPGREVSSSYRRQGRVRRYGQERPAAERVVVVRRYLTAFRRATQHGTKWRRGSAQSTSCTRHAGNSDPGAISSSNPHSGRPSSLPASHRYTATAPRCWPV